VALLAVVDALEHAIFKAVAANSPYGGARHAVRERERERERERHKKQPTSYELRKH
jgi:hypothetical protein